MNHNREERMSLQDSIGRLACALSEQDRPPGREVTVGRVASNILAANLQNFAPLWLRRRPHSASLIDGLRLTMMIVVVGKLGSAKEKLVVVGNAANGGKY